MFPEIFFYLSLNQKSMRYCFLLVFALFNICESRAQEYSIGGYFEASGWLSTRDSLPFWGFSNTNNDLSSQSNFNGILEVNQSLKLKSQARFNAVASYFLRDNAVENLQRKELYVEFENRWLSITVGSKEVQDEFGGLGIVKDNFLLSGNARALPGVLITSKSPTKVSEKIAFDWSIAHYELNDNRFVNGTLVHYKKGGVYWTPNARNRFYAGLEHVAQWGGVSPIEGRQPTGIGDFIDVFLAREANEEATESDQNNALGNSIGAYIFEYTTSSLSADYKFYWNHPIEDGSGTRLENFPDGIWGFYYKPKEDNFDFVLDGLIIEYIQTISQSGGTGTAGRDNYFNNGIYRSGWTYDGATIGLPIIQVPDNNRVQAINLGIDTKFKKINTLFKLTYLRSLGTFASPLQTNRESILSFLNLNYGTNYGKFFVELGYDYINTQNDILGIGFGYSYKL